MKKMSQKRQFQSNLIGRTARITDSDDQSFKHWGYGEESHFAKANRKGTGEIVTVFMGEDSPMAGVLFDDGVVVEMPVTYWEIGEKSGQP